MNKTTNDLWGSRTFRAAIVITGTLFVGAISSGLWELLLRDVVLGLGNWTLSIISSMWGGYVDLLHRDIGKLRDDLLILPILAFVMTFVFVVPWLAILILLRRIKALRRKVLEEEGEEEGSLNIDEIISKLSRLRKMVILILLPLTILSIINFLVIGWQLAYTRNAGVWADRSIEILAPYITNNEHLKLRSLLRAVETAEQYYKLEKELNEISMRVSIKLPEFTVIRKPGVRGEIWKRADKTQ